MSSTIVKFARIFFVPAALSIMLICIQTISAQETRGTIRGTVTDPNKQAVANASVQVIDPSRGTKVSLTTNGEGLYTANYLFPGEYQIVVEATGFKKSIRNNVRLEISGAVTVDVPLEVGGAQETVNVTAEVP